MAGVLRVVAAFTFLTALAIAAAGAAKDARPTAPQTSGTQAIAQTIADGRRLAAEGRFAEAAGKLSAGWTASRDPEVLFDLAVCHERLRVDAQALDEFRAYVRLPLALRLRAAEDHMRGIEARGAREVREPRRVLVPVGGDGGKCFRDCTGPESCRPRFGDRWGLQCAGTQFICLRSCPGARVETGVCATASVRPGETCRAEIPP
jgi:hypothetical protein